MPRSKPTKPDLGMTVALFMLRWAVCFKFAAVGFVLNIWMESEGRGCLKFEKKGCDLCALNWLCDSDIALSRLRH